MPLILWGQLVELGVLAELEGAHVRGDSHRSLTGTLAAELYMAPKPLVMTSKK